METAIGQRDNIVRARQVGPFSAEHNAWLTLKVVEKYKGYIDPAERWKDGIIHFRQGERGVNLSPGQECILSFNDYRLPVGRYEYGERPTLIEDGKLKILHSWGPGEILPLDQFKKIVADESARHSRLPVIADWLAKAARLEPASFRPATSDPLRAAKTEAVAWDRAILGPAPFLANPPNFQIGSLDPGVDCEFIRTQYAKPMPALYIMQTRDWWVAFINLGRDLTTEAAEANLNATFGRKVRVHWNRDPLLTEGHIEFVDQPASTDPAETSWPLWTSSLDCALLDSNLIIYTPKRRKADPRQPLQSDLASNAHWWTK